MCPAISLSPWLAYSTSPGRLSLEDRLGVKPGRFGQWFQKVECGLSNGIGWVRSRKETSVAGPDSDNRATLTGLRVNPQASPDQSEATRYLCAAAHLDRGLKGQPGTQLRQQVVDSLMGDQIHAIGTSPGVDLRQVVLEVNRAARRKLTRDLALCVLLVLAFVLGVLGRSLPVLLSFFVLACEVVHIEAWIATYSVVARRMLRGQFQALLVVWG